MHINNLGRITVLEIKWPLLVVEIFAYGYGYLAIFRGEWKPSKFSWLIWVFIDLMILFTTKASGNNTESLWLLRYYIVGSGIVALLAFRYGESGWTWWDIGCLAGGILSVVIWKIIGTAEFPLILALIGHFCGFMPTIIKSWLRPYNENRIVWFTYIVGTVIAMLGISGFDFGAWTWEAAFFPVYDFILCVFVYVLTLRKVERLNS